MARFMNVDGFYATPLLLFIVLLFATPARSDDITSLFEPDTIIWLDTGEKDKKTDLREIAYEMDADELPVDAEFSIDRKAEDVPLVESVGFVYPEDTPPEQRIALVEVWVLRGKDDTLYRTLYRGPADADIAFTPFAARHVRLRFFGSSGGDTAVLPMVTFGGLESTAGAGFLPDPDPVTFNYVAFRDDTPVGAYTVSRQSIDTGYAYDVSQSMDIVGILPDTREREEEHFEENCHIETMGDLRLDEFTCEYPEEGATVMGREFAGYYELKAQGLDAYEKEDETLSRGRYEPVLPVMIYDVLSRDGLFLGQEREFQVADPYIGKMDRVTARVTDFYPAREGRADLYVVWVSEKKSPDFVRLALVEPDGTVLREYDYNRNLQYWLVEDPDEWAFEPVVFDFDLLIEEMKNTVRDFIRIPDAVERARISIQWNEVPPSSMQLDSERQRLVSVEETEPGVFEAELELIRHKAGDEPLVATEPLSPEQLAPYLAPDDTVETGSKSLRELADKITGDETDPMAMAQLIFNWLVRYILPDNVNSFFVPQASDVIKYKKGDCKYFAVTFATFARIKGIPTRFAFGQRYIGGSYGYHVWNQIYVDGHWLDVDASDLAMAPGALHIQLYTSASFNEKGHTGVLLGFRPDPEILDTEIGPPDYSAVTGKVQAEIGDNYIQDSYFNCRIEVPRPFEYELIDLGFVRKIRLILPDQPQFMASIYLFPKNDRGSLISSGLGMEEYVHMDDLFGSMRAAKAHKYGKTEFAGGEGRFLTGEFKDRDNEFVLFDLTLLRLEDRDIVFHYMGDSELYRDYADELAWLKKNLVTY